jgi:succinyl-diaminopimelate desuccinylase
MKFSIALYISVLKKLYKANKKLPSLAIMLTSDEEVGGINGVGYLVNKVGYTCDVAIVPDGGENNHVVENAKGILHLLIQAKGKGAHAARMWEGQSAIDQLIQGLVNIRNKYPIPKDSVWHNTINFGKISGGVQTNQVSDTAEAYVDIRYVPETEVGTLIRDIQQLSRDCLVTTIIQGDAFSVDRKNKYIKRWSSLLNVDTKSSFIQENIASDGRYFSAMGIPTIVSKPVGGLIHSPKEWTSLSSVMEFGTVIEKFLTLGEYVK